LNSVIPICLPIYISIYLYSTYIFRHRDSSLHVARWLCRNPELVRGRSVHEVGAGVALPGLTSALLGASSTIVSDYDPKAAEVRMFIDC